MLGWMEFENSNPPVAIQADCLPVLGWPRPVFQQEASVVSVKNAPEMNEPTILAEAENFSPPRSNQLLQN